MSIPENLPPSSPPPYSNYSTPSHLAHSSDDELGSALTDLSSDPGEDDASSDGHEEEETLHIPSESSFVPSSPIKGTREEKKRIRRRKGAKKRLLTIKKRQEEAQ
ncbi:hypothetical protein NM688_g2308 [Phlebia brevispora]|uniref:Uncharacterized protein n=1 Tax=Phlebia brevispora TaxID=194682 RepID=A0ACC1T8V7_9APHY|nr:hypothetical protein NM688_g2308 [Phlebia brevispora]